MCFHKIQEYTNTLNLLKVNVLLLKDYSLSFSLSDKFIWNASIAKPKFYFALLLQLLK